VSPGSPTLLLTGFGPFLDVHDNPSADLVRGFNGLQLAGVRVVSEVLPVSWERASQRVLELVRDHDPLAVIGFGVAARRVGVSVESRAHARRVGADVDGVVGTDRAFGPSEVRATLNPARLAAAIEATVSEDAGSYICNAWLYEVASGCDVPTAFIHIPAAGMPHGQLELGLARWLASEGAHLSAVAAKRRSAGRV
jgi:pyroglutamyl-peptidase